MPKKTDAASVPVAIYARYSTDRQDARSIDDQVRRCRVHAATHGFRVIAEYKDAAISGAHTDRADMQKLLAEARTKGGAPFRAVLVDDLSRLSRDLGNTWQIVFHDLASADVKVVDVTTGMSSDGAGARLTFGAMALVNDTFLQLVRAETHRGLEGRALGGFWTGGRCYGYATVTEENPPEPEHPRKRSVVDPVGAALVVRVFRLFADGTALKKIASTLNEEGLAAPNEGGRGNKNGRGWGHTTIRAMLQNERYLGRFTWNQSKYVRVPGRKNRRRVMRPESEWVVREHPELAIVPKELWDAAQARFRRVYSTARGRPAGTGHHVHLVSGLMRCGVCGGSMTIVGRKAKAGVSYARFGCTLFRCRVRCCPTCARDEANRRSAVMARRIKAMAFPILTEFKLVVPLKGLGGALDAIRDALACLRRRKCLASIPSATGAFHAAPLGARAWTAHCHVVFHAGDIVEDDDDLAEWEASVDAQFRPLTGGRGRFSIDPKEPLVDVPERMARYICKPETCAPTPGRYSPAQLDALLSALHGSPLVIHWGSTARGRRFAPAA